MYLFARHLWRLVPASIRLRFWRLRGLVFQYQQVSYRGKVLVRGVDRMGTYRIIFPDPPKGRTVLDVGCHIGFYCVQAASEGAQYCLGIDIDERRIRKGQHLVANEGISNVAFVAADVCRYGFDRHFDVVLCLNLLQHMKTIDVASELLYRLYDLTDEYLALIVPLTMVPQLAYEYAFRDDIPYLLFSITFFSSIYGRSARFVELPEWYYGPARLAIIITKDPHLMPADAATAVLPEPRL